MHDWLVSMLNDICGPDLLNAVYNTLSMDLLIQWEEPYNFVIIAYHFAIKPFAIMLLFVYFMIGLLDKLSSESFTWEQLWRQLAMLLVGKYLIDHGLEIFETMYDLGMALMAQIDEYISYTVGYTQGNSLATAEAMIGKFKSGLGIGNWPDWLADLVMMIYLLIPWLLSWIMRLCVNIICYSRSLEIFLRALFLPIAISDFFHHGLQGSGWRYMKAFFAVCLQGALIIAITAIFTGIYQTLIVKDQNLFTFIGAYLAFYAAAIMLMFKSLSLSKEIVGVN